jgi:hypothetical protein
MIKCRDNTVNDLLLFPCFRDVCSAFFIEAREYLFQLIDGVVLDCMPNLLKSQNPGRNRSFSDIQVAD